MSPRRALLVTIQRIEALEGINRLRHLTDAELDELERLETDRALRLRRLPTQIAACEAKLMRLRAEQAVLSPVPPINGRRGTVIIDEYPFAQTELH